jgi:methionyl-tRNA formyltransferase
MEPLNKSDFGLLMTALDTLKRQVIKDISMLEAEPSYASDIKDMDEFIQDIDILSEKIETLRKG